MSNLVMQEDVNMGVDPLEFRKHLGKFPTGVTIVTTSDQQGTPVGMTANSFNSVSLNPPLVLWSIDRSAGCFDAFNESDYFAIHVLGEHQQELSNLFARRGVDRFKDVHTSNGIGCVPLLKDYSVRFECQVEHRYDGGDHVIMVGKVLDMDLKDGVKPLIFHDGQYAALK